MTETVDGFSLIDEPWILVRTQEGVTDEVSLLDLFRRSPGLAEIVGDLPTQGFAILRVALAILHRAVDGPRDERHWQELWDAGAPPMVQVESYLGRFRDRFDLFHPTTPFFQVADLQTANGEPSALDRLIADVPVNKRFFSMRAGRGVARISAAEAARWLVHAHGFDKSGIKSGVVGDSRARGPRAFPRGVAWAGQLGGVYVQGENLWATLLLNLVPRDQPNLVQSSGADLPAWERPQDRAGVDDDLAKRPSGPVDLYTWQSRRVRLVHEGEDVVAVVLSYGDDLSPEDRLRSEPMTVWKRASEASKSGGPVHRVPLRHVPARALWRGLSAVLPLVSPLGKADGEQEFVTAGVVEWAARVLDRKWLVTLRAIGMVYTRPTDEAVRDLVDDRLDISVAVLDGANSALPQAVIDAVSATERAIIALRNLASDLAKAAGAEPALADGARARAAERAYAAIDAPFRVWLADLDADSDPELVRIAWHRRVYAILRRFGEDLVAATGPDAWVGRLVNGHRITTPEADGRFRAALASALPIPAGQTGEEVVA